MKQFSRIYIEITNVCNLSCSFCAGNVRPTAFMTCEQFTHVLEKIRPYTNYINLHVLGEPLLHPKLGDFLEIAHQFGLQVNITTNGTLLAARSDLLCNAPALRKISISVHSLETPDPVVRSAYLRDVAQFANAATAHGKLCELRLWNIGASIDNEDLFAPLCAQLNLDEDAQNNALHALQSVGNITLRKGLFLGKAQRFQWPSLDAPRTNAPVFCHGLRNQAAVLCDGTVTPCCLDSRGDIALGNLFENDLESILNSARAQALYDGFSNRTPSEELCKRCGYATRF